MAGRKSEMQKAEKLTFRIAPRFAERVLEASKSAGVSPNQFGRIATMAAAQTGFLSLSNRLGRVEEELIRLRRDFNDATMEER